MIGICPLYSWHSSATQLWEGPTLRSTTSWKMCWARSSNYYNSAVHLSDCAEMWYQAENDWGKGVMLYTIIILFNHVHAQVVPHGRWLNVFQHCVAHDRQKLILENHQRKVCYLPSVNWPHTLQHYIIEEVKNRRKERTAFSDTTSNWT